MGYTRQQWATDFLKAIGNSNPNQQTIDWVASWTTYETSCCGGASYNLLNTTEPNTPGVVSNFNQVGVKNYNSYSNGILANAKVIRNGYYPNLYNALRSNNTSLLYSNNANINHELGIWGTGAVQQSIASSASYANSFLLQTFGGTMTAVPTGQGANGGQGQAPAGGGGATTTVSTLAPQAVACAPLDIGCGLSNFWNVNVLPFLEHMTLIIFAIILIIVGFILMGGNPNLNPAHFLKSIGTKAAVAA